MNIRVLSLIVLALIVGFAGGYFYFNTSQSTLAQAENCEVKYQFINGRLGCQPKAKIKKHEYTGLQADLESYIAQQERVGKVSHVSVYFRDLIFGPTFGINSAETFTPASLLKLPVLITYLSLAEQDKTLLSKKIKFTNKDLDILSQTSDSSIPRLEENTPYSIDDLLKRMIVYSDNTAYEVLSSYLDIVYDSEAPYRQSMIDLGLIDPRGPTESTISVKSYASIFRQLYNSSYLSAEMSEKALELLSQTKYDKGLAAGIPGGTHVANKFGERTNTDTKEKQLHDCGIIYFSENPYLLCVMTRGDDINELTGVIKDISEKVYKEVDSRKY